MKIALESRVLAAICIADMVSTLWWVTTGAAIEANPVMRFYLDRGVLWFIIVKSLFFIGPLFGLELLRRQRPQFVQKFLRLGIVLYLTCYGIGVWRVNLPNAGANVLEPVQTRTVDR